MASKRISIQGRVQGVGYRAWVDDEARRVGVTSGWVRNRRDGSVEALFAGDAAAVQAMIEACRRGPAAARVAAIEILAENEPAEAGFSVLPTA